MDEELHEEVTGVSLLDLDERSCRFPVARCDDTHFFCGEVRRDPKTRYCAAHHQIVWTKRRPPTQAELKARKAAKYEQLKRKKF